MSCAAGRGWTGRMPLTLAGALIAFSCLALLPATAGAKTVWLCRPGLADNPCAPSLKTTLVSPTGEIEGVRKVKPAKHPKVDCFYVYPTVSDQAGPNATRAIDPEQRSIALYQAARYSKVCRVFAPMYRQVTIPALFGGGFTPERLQIAYSDVLEAWRTYLKNYNRGRGVVLIGHSQGTFHLDRLVAEQIDPRPDLRKRLVSAILLGGNVTVAKGRKAGGDFKHVPGCRSATQTGCVVAFSTFDAPVPATAIFGHSSDPAKRDVLCTNPAALGGGSAKLDSVFPSEPFAPGTTIGAATLAVGAPTPPVTTPWYEFRGAYRGACSGADNAHVLQITPLGGAPALLPVPTADWGLHLVDANIALGNLTDLVGREVSAFVRKRS